MDGLGGGIAPIIRVEALLELVAQVDRLLGRDGRRGAGIGEEQARWELSNPPDGGSLGGAAGGDPADGGAGVGDSAGAAGGCGRGARRDGRRWR
jgi:hypothetical protein